MTDDQPSALNSLLVSMKSPLCTTRHCGYAGGTWIEQLILEAWHRQVWNQNFACHLFEFAGTNKRLCTSAWPVYEPWNLVNVPQDISQDFYDNYMIIKYFSM